MKTCAWILLLVFLAPLSLFAQNQSAPDKNDLLSIRVALEDDLEALLQWARRESGQTDRDKEPAAWIHLQFAEAAVLLSMEQLPDPWSYLREAVELARKLQLHEEYVLLMEVSSGIRWDAGDEEGEEKKYEQLANLAHERKLPHLEARYQALKGYVLMAKGDYDKGLQPMLEAQNLLQTYPGIDALDRMNIKSALGQAFASGSDAQRAMALDKEIVEYARSKNLRGMLASSLHNIAGYYETEGGAKLKDAKAYYTEALKIGRSLGSHYTIGPCLIGLSAIARQESQLQDSIRYALEAVTTFKDGMSYWKAEAWMSAAESQVESKAYDAALHSLAAAEKSNPPDLVRMLVKIQQLRAKAYEKKNKPLQALAALKAFVASNKEIKKNEDQSSYSKRLAQLGMELEQEKNESLTKENELQSQKLKSAERIQNLTLGLLVLVIGALSLLLLAVLKAREVRRRKFKMQRILDNIDEGILTINQDLQIEGEYSQHLLRFLGIDHIPKKADALDTILQHARIDGETRGMMREILKLTLGEKALAWELNEANLPRELLFEGDPVRTAALNWVPIFDQNGHLRRVLLSLRDQTERVKLKAEIQRHRLLLNRKELEVTELVNQDPGRCHAILDACVLWLEAAPGKGDSELKKQALRQLHTIKGNARSTGLWQLSHAIHEIEGELQRSGDHEMSLPGSAELLELIKEYRHLLDDILRPHGEAPQAMQYLSDTVRPLIQDLTQRLEAAGCRLGRITVSDAVLRWDVALIRSVADMLMHALNNSIDHGFLRSDARDRASRAAELDIRAFPEERSLCIEVLDNGAGLDLQKITRRAQELRLVPLDHNPYQVLFEDGFSTARGLSESSGRGVGLSAIVDLGRQWQGSVSISPGPGQRGTLLRIVLPFPNAAFNSA